MEYSQDKAAFNKKKEHFISKFDLSLRKKQMKCHIWGSACMVMKVGSVGGKIRNTWQISKRVSGSG
jgi:hypothetical protein